MNSTGTEWRNTGKLEFCFSYETSASDHQIIAINLKIHGFNIRLVNVYSLIESDSSENKKDSFSRLLNKAYQKQEKHEKQLAVTNFNAKSSLTFKKSCYDGTNVIPDDDCNNNGTHLKKFCMSNRICIALT